MKTSEQVIKKTVSSLFVKGLIQRNGWTVQQAAEYVLEFVTCGTSLSFFDFMNNKIATVPFRVPQERKP